MIHGSITAPKDAVPEGRLVFQLNSGLEVLSHGATESVSLGGGRITAYGVSPDGEHVLAASYVTEPTNYVRDGELLTIDTTTGDRRSVLVRASPKEDVGPAAWSPDGSEVAYRLTVLPVDPAKRFPHGTTEQTVCIVEVATKAARCFSGLGPVYTFDWSPDGRDLIVAGQGAYPVHLVDVTTGRVSTLVAQQGSTPINRAIAGRGWGESIQLVDPIWSPSGQYLAALANLRGSDLAYVPVIFTPAGQPVALGRPSGEFPEPLGWSQAQDLLAYTQGEAPYAITELYLLDPATGEDRLLYSTGHGDRAPIIVDVAWSPSGRWLAVATARRTLYLPQTVRIIDVTRGGPTHLIHLGPQDISDSLVGWGP